MQTGMELISMSDDAIRRENTDLRSRVAEAQAGYATIREVLDEVRTKLEGERDAAQKSRDMAWKLSDIYRNDWDTAQQRAREAERHIAQLEGDVVPEGDAGLEWLDMRLKARGEFAALDAAVETEEMINDGG